VCRVRLSGKGGVCEPWGSNHPRSLNQISDEAGIPPEFKHIIKGRKRN
jgi:hypothetical protein